MCYQILIAFRKLDFSFKRHTVIVLACCIFPQIFIMLCNSLYLTFSFLVHSGFWFCFVSFRVVSIINMMFLLQKDCKRMVCLLSGPLKQGCRFVLKSAASIFSINYCSVSLHYLKGEANDVVEEVVEGKGQRG